MLSEEKLTELFRYSFSLIDSRMTPNQQAFCRAIESAATAPLLARIAELTKQLEEARKDAELLDWMIFYSARLSHSNDAECCQVIWVNGDGEQRTKPFGNAREAIRAAIKEQT